MGINPVTLIGTTFTPLHLCWRDTGYGGLRPKDGTLCNN